MDNGAVTSLLASLIAFVDLLTVSESQQVCVERLQNLRLNLSDLSEPSNSANAAQSQEAGLNTAQTRDFGSDLRNYLDPTQFMLFHVGYPFT